MTPTRKWMAAFATGLGTLAVLGIEQGTGQPFWIALTGFLVERAVSYLTPNAEVPPAGGVGVGPDPADAAFSLSSPQTDWTPIHPRVEKRQA